MVPAVAESKTVAIGELCCWNWHVQICIVRPSNYLVHLVDGRNHTGNLDPAFVCSLPFACSFNRNQFEGKCTGASIFIVDTQLFWNFEQGEEAINPQTERDRYVVALPEISGSPIAKLIVSSMAGTDTKLQSDWCFAHRPIPILILSRKLGSSQQRSKRSSAGGGV